MKLEVLSDTFFKANTKQSSQLAAAEKILVKKGTEYQVQSHAPASNDHVKVALLNASLQGKNTWYIYAPHVEIDGKEPGNNPNDQDKPAPRNDGFKLPGFSSTFYLGNPIIQGGHFTWAEATKNGTRIPPNKLVVGNIIKIAKHMEDVRKYLGNRTISINSWYRDPATNRRVGGASRSRHLSGDAIDFNVVGMRPPEVFARLNGWWGSRGGLASSSAFTHIDARGYKARWDYGY